MSVPEGERKKGNLEVLIKARDLAIYTTTILSNRNVFAPEINAELIHRIEQCALDIAGFTFSANNIRAGTNPENRRIRYDLQERAITLCDEMHMYINVAKSVAKLGFTLHKEKTFIIPVTKGFLFLGFRYVLTATGKVLRIVDSSRVSAERRKLARMAGKVRRSEMTIAKMDQCFQSWLAHASKGNNHGLVRNMKRYYKQLQEV